MSAYVLLRLDAEAYAMPVGHVREVAGLGPIAAVPGSRPELLGLANLRGQVLPVVDLARLLGVPRAAPPSRLLVAETGGRRAGFAVSEVSGVGEVADPAEVGDSDLLAGAVLRNGELIGIIDTARVFDSLAGTP